MTQSGVLGGPQGGATEPHVGLERIGQRIAQELNVREAQVLSTFHLLDEGATVPFIARYRKEATGGLDDTQLRQLAERREYLTELEKRRMAILSSIEEQGKLSPTLKQEILQAETKTVLEDLYLPYKPKRRTKAQTAREAGLEPLAEALLKDPNQVPERLAVGYVNPEKGVADGTAALEGAHHILVERFSEASALVGSLRSTLWNSGVVVSTVVKGKETEGQKFADYFDYDEPLKAIPSHRALALFRGKKEGILRVALKLAAEKQEHTERTHQMEGRIAQFFQVQRRNRPADDWIYACVVDAWKEKLFPHLETDLMGQLKDEAEAEAIQVFAKNLHDLLLAAPAGPRVTMGLDPGLRTGVKVVVVDGTGKVVETGVIYPHTSSGPGSAQWQQSINQLGAWAKKHHVSLISIGNGTASRETDRLVQDFMKQHPTLNLSKLVVSEAGASVYSASELAAKELPTLDVTLRGAVSIARRLQDPLAELVKIDPKAIGVGQYQHDVDQGKLGKALDAVVEDCVNAVGVDVNTASPALLTYVAGLSASLAQNLVTYREANGPFKNRTAFKKVPKLGPKAFEQCAGFLRIMAGDNPLDASAVHPEAYPVVERIVKASGRSIKDLMGDNEYLRKLAPKDFVDERFGVPTVQDILAELEKPGRDPRPEFKTATFLEGVESMSDLKPGMRLEGVVTNVTNFGAFVDVGVHQDGLVHISQLADRFVKDPHTVVKTGDVVKVRVVEVDVPRKRISLSMKEV